MATNGVNPPTYFVEEGECTPGLLIKHTYMCVIISQIYECNYITTISVIRKHSCICGVKAHILCLLSWNRILFIKKDSHPKM